MRALHRSDENDNRSDNACGLFKNAVSLFFFLRSPSLCARDQGLFSICFPQFLSVWERKKGSCGVSEMPLFCFQVFSLLLNEKLDFLEVPPVVLFCPAPDVFYWAMEFIHFG